jgi:RNA 2',3'-cyclic 3'-phosphodiesterase
VRCFVALDLPEPVRNHVANVVRPLCERFALRAVPAAQLHVTLVFAGDIDHETVDALAANVRALDLPPLSLQLQRLGHFPPRGIPRVLWVGLGGDVGELGELQQHLAAAAAELGVEREKRGFTPHVTFARVTSEFGALALVDALQQQSAELRQKPFAPTQLALYASELTPRGPIHRPLVRRPVPGAPGWSA